MKMLNIDSSRDTQTQTIQGFSANRSFYDRCKEFLMQGSSTHSQTAVTPKHQFHRKGIKGCLVSFFQVGAFLWMQAALLRLTQLIGFLI